MRKPLMTERDALRWLIEEMVETRDGLTDLPDIPRHECEFFTNPEKGACEYHDRFTECLSLAGYFETRAANRASKGET